MRVTSRGPVRPVQAPQRPLVVTPAPALRPAPLTWDRQSYLPSPSFVRPPDAQALAAGRRIFSISQADSQREAAATGAFFKSHPSLGGQQIALFHAYWGAHQTFQTHPLQAYLYHTTRPVDEQGQPRGPLWQAYADAVAGGASPAVIERAFFKAHTTDFKRLAKDPQFKRLFALADTDYRKVVEAYFDGLQQADGQLASGNDPVKQSRKLFMDTNYFLMKRGAKMGGFMATTQGLKAMVNPKNPLGRQIWRSSLEIGKGMLGIGGDKAPAPKRVTVSLSAPEAQILAARTGIPFKPGRQDLTAAMLRNAFVQEPVRGDRPTAPRPRLSLTLNDFLAPQKLRDNQPMAGSDGLMSAREVDGVLRNVQARARSQSVHTFFEKYPVPEAGILIYSANMLAMNGAYGQSEMFNTLANAIMPVNANGEPKDAYWRAYAEAYDRHKATGAPSMETLESLWFRAHMHDFDVVDTPAFQAQLEAFWTESKNDKAMAPMRVYTQAMVGGRQVFEKAEAEQVSEDTAFFRSLTHFTKTIAGSGSFPFWQQDLQEGFQWLKHRNEPALDARGLPTDHTLFARSVQGLNAMRGLTRIAKEGVSQKVSHAETRRPVSGPMVDLKTVLTPEQLAQVDPKIVAFYNNPASFDIRTGADFGGGLSRLVLGELGPMMSGLGNIPDAKPGFEDFPLESELYTDAKGQTHWDRYVVVDGERKPLFEARFEAAGKQVKETFTIKGKTVALYFDVEVYQGGLRLTLDPKKSSLGAKSSQIVFTTVPTAEGLATTGSYRSKAGLVTGQVEMRMTPKGT